MEPDTPSQGGFRLGRIVIIVIAAGLALVLLLIWHSGRNNKTSQVSSNVSTFSECQQASGSKIQQSYPEVCTTSGGKQFTQNTGSGNGTTDNTNYLVVKEWGVRLKATGNTSSLNYYIYPNNPVFAFLSLKTVSNIETNCAADKFALATIKRLTSEEYASAVKGASDSTNATGYIKAGNYYYMYSSRPCHAQSDSAQAAVDQLMAGINLEDNFKTLAVTPS